MPGDEESTPLLDTVVADLGATCRGRQAAAMRGRVTAATSTPVAVGGIPRLRPGWARDGHC
jgi:hypothetical protein